MKTTLLALPLLLLALVFAGCSAHVNENGPRRGEASGTVDSGSASGSVSGSASGSGSVAGSGTIR